MEVFIDLVKSSANQVKQFTGWNCSHQDIYGNMSSLIITNIEFLWFVVHHQTHTELLGIVETNRNKESTAKWLEFLNIPGIYRIGIVNQLKYFTFIMSFDEQITCQPYLTIFGHIEAFSINQTPPTSTWFEHYYRYGTYLMYLCVVYIHVYISVWFTIDMLHAIKCAHYMAMA